MYVVVEHEFKDPQVAFARGDRLIKNEGAPASTASSSSIPVATTPAPSASGTRLRWRQSSTTSMSRSATPATTPAGKSRPIMPSLASHQGSRSHRPSTSKHSPPARAPHSGRSCASTDLPANGRGAHGLSHESRARYRRFRWSGAGPSWLQRLHGSTKVGELAQAVREGSRPHHEHEIGDVLAWLASLATSSGCSSRTAVPAGLRTEHPYPARTLGARSPRPSGWPDILAVRAASSYERTRQGRRDAQAAEPTAHGSKYRSPAMERHGT